MLAHSPVKVAWIAPFPVGSLEPDLVLARRPGTSHPCSWIVALAEAVARHPDVELHLVTQTTLVRRSQTLRQGGIWFHVIAGGVPGLCRGFPPWLPVDVLTRFRWEVNRCRRALDKIGPDLVHAHGTEGPNALAALATGLPHLISIQGIIGEYCKTNPTFRFRVVRHWERQAVRRGRNFTCRTAFDTEFVRSTNPRARIFAIHEAMRPAFFAVQWQPRAEDSLLYVGSLEERKGLPVLLAALREVLRQRPATRLTVIGGGDRAGYEARCQQWGLGQQVQFLGFQTAEQIAAQATKAQLFVLPSRNENSPNALAEAMVAGMPVIATAVGGIPSMVEHGRTGWLVPGGEVKPLAEAILRLLGSPVDRQALGQAARALARDRHSPERVAEQTVAAYHQILEDHQ